MHLPKPLCLNASSLTRAKALGKLKGHLSWSGYAITIAFLAPFTNSLPSQAQDIPLYSSQFIDTADNWANVCIEGMSAEGLMKGYPDGSFKPDGTITRAEFAAVMIKAFPDAAKVRKAPSFSDVAANFWGRSAIATAYEKGFLSGYPDNIFKPNQAITRAQAMVVIANAQQLSPGEVTTEKINTSLQQYFEDATTVPDYAKGLIFSLNNLGVVVNYPNVKQLRPNANISRAEATALLCRIKAFTTSGKYYTPDQYVSNIGGEWTLNQDFTLKSAIPLPQSMAGSISGLLNTTATLNQKLFFFMNESESDSEMWGSDGTVAGTSAVTRLAITTADPKGETGLSRPEVIASSAEGFWLSEKKYQSETSSDSLWFSNGSADGTRSVISLSPNLQQLLSQPETILEVQPDSLLNNRFLFVVSASTGPQIWSTNGINDAGTQLLANFSEPDSSIANHQLTLLSATEQYMFFHSSLLEREDFLGRSDGTAEGTIRLANISPVSTAIHNNRAYFTAFNPTVGWELWTSDGSVKGTAIVQNINLPEEGALPQLLAGLGDRFFVLSQSLEGLELWETQGASGSTKLVQNLGADYSLQKAQSVFQWQGKLYFNVEVRRPNQPDDGYQNIKTDTELWVTDGTTSGTKRLATVAVEPNSFTPFKGQLFFVGDGGEGKELWATAGNPKDTRQIIDLMPGSIQTEPPPCAAPLPGEAVSEYCQSVKIARSADVRSLTVRGDFLYFIVSDTALMRTDGTALGMQLVKRFTGGPIRDFPANLVKLDNNLLFMGFEDGNILLWSLPE